MRHNVDGRKFGRNTSHRVAMFRNMANSVIEKEQVITTVQKAKEVRRVVDRLVTLGKTGTPAARRMAFDRTRDDGVVKKLFTELATRYKARAGGYTRVLKLTDRRWGDAAEMAVIEMVDHPTIDRRKKVKPVKAGSDQGETEAQATAPKDPLNRFRKLFQGGSKVGAAKAHKSGKAGAGKRTMAGGGGSKAGGGGSS